MEKINLQTGISGEYIEHTNETLITLNSENSIKESVSNTFDCEKCEKSYKRKYNLKQHVENKHKANEALKLILRNENLRLQIKIYSDQIKLKKTYFNPGPHSS